MLLLSLRAAGEGSTEVTIHSTYSKDYKIGVLLNIITSRLACATRSATCSFKMPLLQLTKLSKIVTAIFRLPLAAHSRLLVQPIGHILPMLLTQLRSRPFLAETGCRMNRGWRGKTNSFSRTGCLASLWPLGPQSHSVSQRSLGGELEI